VTTVIESYGKAALAKGAGGVGSRIAALNEASRI
jgi:hypothetical protein